MAKVVKNSHQSPDTAAPAVTEFTLPPRPMIDSFTRYEELKLADGRVLRRYDTGSVRLENLKSGVIQEERADGSLLLSLPTGKIVFQEFRGEPLLVYNPDDRSLPPDLARVSNAVIPGETEPRFVFHFQDREGTHLVDLEKLRYFRIKPKT